MLKIDPIYFGNKLEVNAALYPPNGKKLNHASYIKIYEKIKDNWEEVDEIIPNENIGFEAEYILRKNMQTSKNDSELALEAEFIHCNLKGGQCAMERFLGKIARSRNINKNKINITLRIN